MTKEQEEIFFKYTVTLLDQLMRNIDQVTRISNEPDHMASAVALSQEIRSCMATYASICDETNGNAANNKDSQ